MVGQFISKAVLKRIALTLVALWGLGVLLYLFEQGLFLSQPLPDRADFLASFESYEQEEPDLVEGREGLNFPAFPSSRRTRTNPTLVNGIMVNSETFETTASSQAILDFYIDQMTARGWTDVTENVHNTSPDVLASSQKGASLQEQHSLAVLDSFTNSELILHGGDHMMHVKTKRGDVHWKTEATVVVSASHSVEEMGSLIDVGIVANLPRRGLKKFMDVTEYGEKNTYHTQQWVTREDPGPVFERLSEELSDDGWKTVIPDLAMSEDSEFFGTYMRKDAYAVLAVSKQEGIGGAMASLSISE